jgi:hypothetical protein
VVEFLLPKQAVASSSLVARSNFEGELSESKRKKNHCLVAVLNFCPDADLTALTSARALTKVDMCVDRDIDSSSDQFPVIARIRIKGEYF